MAGDRELPPLRIKITGDASGYKKTVQKVKDLTEDLGKSVKGTAKAVAKANKDAEKEFLRQFHNHRLLEKSKEKDFDRQFGNHTALEKSKETARKKAEQAAKDAATAAKKEEDRLFSNEVLLEKSRGNAKKARQEEQKALDKIGKQQDTLAQAIAEAAFDADKQVAKSTEKQLKDAQNVAEKEESRRASRRKARQEEQKALDKIGKQQDTLAQAIAEAAFDADKQVAKSTEKQLKDAQNVAQKEEARRAARRKARKEEQKALDKVGKQQDTLAQAIAEAAFDADKQVAKSTEKQLKDAKKVADTRIKQEEETQKYLNRLRETSRKQEARAAEVARREARQDAIRAERYARQDAHRAEMAKRRSRGSRYESFGGLGDRADIYMHTNAIRTILDMAGGFIRASADWQMMSVQLEVLTGSAEKAAEVMERMRVLALESPYDMQTIMDGTKRMIAYGASIDQATMSVQQLLDVAGGDNVKLDKLTLAMAQIFSKKVLKGDELRQLTEHGFNPLQTIAEKTGIDIAELTKMQQEGMITAEMVAKALDIETAAGGRFANMSFKMSWTLKGMVQQVEELIKLIQKRFMDTLLKDAERYMRILVDMLKRTDEWLGKAENQAWVKSMAEMAAKAMIAAVAFNVLGLAVAGIRWQLRIMGTLVGIVTGAIQAMTAAVAGLRKALVATKAAMAALAANNPVGWILLAVAAVVALIAAFTGSGGLKGALTSTYETGKWVFEGIQGFLYNFKHNMSVIGPWLLNNWGKLWMAMANITIRSFGVITGWLIEVLPGQIVWAIERAAVAIAQTITNVMQTMKEIVSFAWQNLSDPEAILRFIGSKFAKGYTDGATSGLMTGLQKAWTEELSHIQGPGLKWDIPGLKDPGVPNAPALKAPEDVDFKSMLGAGGAEKTAGGSSRGPIQAVREGSAEQALLIYEQTQGITAAKANDPQLKVNQEQLGVLAMIEKNTRRTNGGQSINIAPANLAGVGVA